MRRLVVIVALALLTGLSGTAAAATPRTSLDAVQRDVMCVSCGVPLNTAESPQADRERAFIADLVGRGLTKQQILDRLVDEYGPNVLAMPKGDGFGKAAYLVPIAAVLAAIALLAVVLPRWRRRRAAGPGAVADPLTEGAELSADDARRLDADLARYEV